MTEERIFGSYSQEEIEALNVVACGTGVTEHEGFRVAGSAGSIHNPMNFIHFLQDIHIAINEISDMYFEADIIIRATGLRDGHFHQTNIMFGEKYRVTGLTINNRGTLSLCLEDDAGSPIPHVYYIPFDAIEDVFPEYTEHLIKAYSVTLGAKSRIGATILKDKHSDLVINLEKFIGLRGKFISAMNEQLKSVAKTLGSKEEDNLVEELVRGSFYEDDENSGIF